MKSDASQQHRFFNALVLMGGSVAVGCGGVENDRSARETGLPGTGGRPPVPDGAGGSRASGPGGSSVIASGGFGAGSIILVPSAGGAPGAGGYITFPASGGGAPAFLDGGPSACPPSQWDCSSAGVSCLGNARGWYVPDNCRCDPRRPASDADCGKGESFVCREGSVPTSSGSYQDLLFECYCVPNATDCAVCDSLYAPRWNASCDVQSKTNGRMDVLCGCAVVYLR